MCKHAAEDSLIFTLVLGTIILAVVSPERVPISSIKTFDCYFSYEILTTPNMTKDFAASSGLQLSQS